MNSIETITIQNMLRKQLNEIDKTNVQYYTMILDKIGYIIPQFDNLVNEFRIDSRYTSRVPEKLGDFIQYKHALHILTNDKEKQDDVITLINSI